MPWVRVDDGYAEHPKMLAVGPLGQALWLAGLAYCNRNLTDGFIPWAAASRLVSWEMLRRTEDGRELIWQIGIGTGMHGEDVSNKFVVDMLIDVGLWDEVAGGYRVHDYDDYQPTKAQVMAEREAKVAAGRAGGKATAAARGAAPAKPTGQAKSQPVPNPKPVPNPVSEPLALASENARDGWDEPEGEALTWLARHGCDIRPGNGYHRHLVTAVERFGVHAVIGKFDRLSDAGVHDGDLKGFIFGAIDALNPKPDLKALEREDRDEDRREDFARKVSRTKRDLAQIYEGESA